MLKAMSLTSSIIWRRRTCYPLFRMSLCNFIGALRIARSDTGSQRMLSPAVMHLSSGSIGCGKAGRHDDLPRSLLSDPLAGHLFDASDHWAKRGGTSAWRDCEPRQAAQPALSILDAAVDRDVRSLARQIQTELRRERTAG